MAIAKDYTPAVGGTGTKLPSKDMGKAFVLSQTLDCSVDNIGANDTALMLCVPPDTYIAKVIATVKTVEGGTLTFNVGTFDPSGVALESDGFIAGANGNASLVYASPTGVANYPNGDYAANGTTLIGLTCLNAADTAVIKVTAVCYAV
ncbi:MAG: hypothetical protein JW713_05835 [Pontiellaceae bacterium]|nr:hypothetical protein [Pontiellaceae bacterium]